MRKHQTWMGIALVALSVQACSGDEGGTGGDGGGISNNEAGAGTGTGSDGGQGGHGIGGHGGTSQGAPPACAACFESVFTSGSACNDAIQACDDDPGCDSWKNCAELCFAEDDATPCYQACDAAHPHDTTLSEPLFSCVCQSCDSQCVTICSLR